jgi:hypothetical protein
MLRYLQAPQNGNRKSQHKEVGDNIDHSASYDHTHVIGTLGRDRRGPLRPDGNALEDGTDHLRNGVGDDEYS